MGTVASFTCGDTYRLHGFESITCLAEGSSWDETTPLCFSSGNKISLLLKFLQMRLVSSEIIMGCVTSKENITSHFPRHSPFTLLNFIPTFNYASLSLVNGQITHNKSLQAKGITICT